jgi:hypothetical protein
MDMALIIFFVVFFVALLVIIIAIAYFEGWGSGYRKGKAEMQKCIYNRIYDECSVPVMTKIRFDDEKLAALLDDLQEEINVDNKRP